MKLKVNKFILLFFPKHFKHTKFIIMFIKKIV